MLRNITENTGASTKKKINNAIFGAHRMIKQENQKFTVTRIGLKYKQLSLQVGQYETQVGVYEKERAREREK